MNPSSFLWGGSRGGGGGGGREYLYYTLDFAHRSLTETDSHDDSEEMCFLLDDGWSFELCAEYVDAEDELIDSGSWGGALEFYAF